MFTWRPRLGNVGLARSPLAPTDYPAGGTIFDRLHDAGVTWKDYFNVSGVAATMDLFPPLLVKYPSHLASTGDFFTDAAAGTLPGYSLVEPDYGNTSEEDPQNIASGEQFAARPRQAAPGRQPARSRLQHLRARHHPAAEFGYLLTPAALS